MLHGSKWISKAFKFVQKFFHYIASITQKKEEEEILRRPTTTMAANRKY